ncbi:hypothetical protein C5167_050264 [Papaver somniferum]|uniref:Uncharacterized protein n=1 Tax=Papaver somniferum TaxID=3469 RepID=A0A4Y7KRL0_PAPSO|nr:hypothetical protein C5167_050264 [Papaver somniferum]
MPELTFQHARHCIYNAGIGASMPALFSHRMSLFTVFLASTLTGTLWDLTLGYGFVVVIFSLLSDLLFCPTAFLSPAYLH